MGQRLVVVFGEGAGRVTVRIGRFVVVEIGGRDLGVRFRVGVGVGFEGVEAEVGVGEGAKERETVFFVVGDAVVEGGLDGLAEMER